MDGEPHLGKVIECTYTFDREEILEAILEAIVDAILDDCDDFMLGEFDDFMLGEFDEYISIGEFLDEDELERVRLLMEEKLLDDDYGSGKDYDLVYDAVDKVLSEKAEYEFETTEHRSW